MDVMGVGCFKLGFMHFSRAASRSLWGSAKILVAIFQRICILQSSRVRRSERGTRNPSKASLSACCYFLQVLLRCCSSRNCRQVRKQEPLRQVSVSWGSPKCLTLHKKCSYFSDQPLSMHFSASVSLKNSGCLNHPEYILLFKGTPLFARTPIFRICPQAESLVKVVQMNKVFQHILLKIAPHEGFTAALWPASSRLQGPGKYRYQTQVTLF